MTTTPQRIHVIGTSGSGKTTFAGRVAECLEIPHVELDALHWGQNWTEPAVNEFREKVAAALEGDAWAVDGNYSKVRDIIWERADTVVWLDYPLPVVMARVIWRTFRRGLTREELWNENRERLIGNLFSKDSIILWSFTTYHRRKREYPELFKQPEYRHINFVRLRLSGEGREWVGSLRKS
jgi:adenylate kinase family enzyme